MDNDEIYKSLIVIATEIFRIDNVFEKLIEKADFEDRNKYKGQYSWFVKKTKNAIKDAGLEVVDLKGCKYDPGMAVVPLNLEEFDPEDELYVDYLIEPVIMKEGQILKEGTALLKKQEEIKK